MTNRKTVLDAFGLQSRHPLALQQPMMATASAHGDSSRCVSTSISRRGRFYTLPEIARFDDLGLWSYQAVGFSRHGTLMATLESWTHKSPQGWFADELAAQLHVDVQDPLRELVLQGRLRRSDVAGRFLYTVVDARLSKDQIRARGAAQAIPLMVNAKALLVSPDELKAAILLFYSLLNEQQRRLFAGLESIKAWLR